ncbi:aldehyde dehydrogenase [Candidatus Woesearchaeota archaeon]|nr:MAG: aldehyde dehydrogenase [Candidatus Woesearchaeota archaeon]
MVKVVEKYINGRFENSNEYYEVKDVLESEVVLKIAVSTMADLRKVYRNAKVLQQKLEQVELSERVRIIKQLYELYVSKIKLEYLPIINKLHGTVDDDVLAPLESLKEWVYNLDEYQKIVFGAEDALQNGVKVVYNGKQIGLKSFRPRGPLAIIFPANMEAAEQFYVLAQAILSGNHFVVRSSSKDVTTCCLFECLDYIGFSCAGQMLSWQSSAENALEMTRRLIKNSEHSIIFASNETINKIMEGVEAKNVFKYGTGLPIVFVTHNAELETAARSVMLSAVAGKGCHCISTTPVFVDEKVYDQFCNELEKVKPEFDAMAEKRLFTKVEVESIKSFIEKDRFNFKAKLGNIYDHNLQCLMVKGAEKSSRFFFEEIPAMVVAVAKYDDINNAIEYANKLAHERKIFKHILAVVYGDKKDYMVVRKKLNAYMVKHNEGSAEFNWFLPHQGRYFVEAMVEVIN